MEYIIILFYIYTSIEDPKSYARKERILAMKYGLKGRMIVSHEGLNGTYEGTSEDIQCYCNELQIQDQFKTIQFKKSKGTGKIFPRLSIKVRSEIVSAHLGKDDVNPEEKTGSYLRPEDLKKWIKEHKDFEIIDMRNDYEFISGHFENSNSSGMENFRDLPNVPEKFAHLKDKTVLTVCTGGVRCEKASAYLLKKGFKDVHQLEGGIVSYMEKYPGEDFKGTLYVFDNRITMDFIPAEKREVIGRCYLCASPAESYVNCFDDYCHYHFICCTNCMEKNNYKVFFSDKFKKTVAV